MKLLLIASFFLLNSWEGYAGPLDNRQVWHMNTTHILPAVKSSQRCSFHKSPNVNHKQQIIEEIQLPSPFVHHIDIFRCSAAPGKTLSETFDEFLTPDGFDCDERIIPSQYCQYYCFWSCPFPPPENRYPSNVAHTFDGNQYMYLVTHLENPELLENVPVTAGVAFPYVTDTKEFESGFLRVGRYVSYKNLIPPNSVDFMVPHTCKSDCTKRLEQNMNIFGITFHAHESAKQVKLLHLRDGKEVSVIAHDVQYSPEQPFKFKKLEKHVQFLPGDEFLVECTYDTTWKKGQVLIGGNTLESEMCIAFIEYYPRSLKISNCGTTVSANAIHEFFGIIQMDSEENVNPKVISPTRFKGMSFTDVVKSYEWTHEERGRFQELMLNGERDAYCIPE
jgi:hypothetical protein